MTKKLPSVEILHKLLRYDPKTGKLFWKTATVDAFEDGKHSAERKCKAWNAQNSGKEALAYRDNKNEYAYGSIFGKNAMRIER